ncbi:hypothetical protein [Mycobacterium sp. ACS1612]|uniref:hypothetical protein n=1 Tax=Mycobacterium sp. ACS1612 TaxID=1834117 RepID=UPI0009EDFFCC|nr:hypothetical protein [Mycobacterium sp. ACS1612]
MTSIETVHIAEGRPWKDALIGALEPRSPYRAWHASTDIASGEPVIGVLDTDPPALLAAVGIVGLDGDVGQALGRIDDLDRSGLLELGTLNAVGDFTVRPGARTVYYRDSYEAFVDTLDGYRWRVSESLFGATSLAAARILLHSGGSCAGCGQRIDLTGEDARDRVHLHTVAPRLSEAPADWPAALCDSCHDRMRRDGFTSFVDLRFALNPRCPSCSAQRTMSTMYGMPAGPVEQPWIAAMGCCVQPWEWCCAECGHEW